MPSNRAIGITGPVGAMWVRLCHGKLATHLMRMQSQTRPPAAVLNLRRKGGQPVACLLRLDLTMAAESVVR